MKSVWKLSAHRIRARSGFAGEPMPSRELFEYPSKSRCFRTASRREACFDFSNNVVRIDTQAPADHDEFDNVQSAFPALILGNERLMPAESNGQFLLGHAGFPSSRNQPLQQNLVFFCKNGFQAVLSIIGPLRNSKTGFWISQHGFSTWRGFHREPRRVILVPSLPGGKPPCFASFCPP